MKKEIEEIKIKNDLDKWGVKIVNKESFLKHRQKVKDDNMFSLVLLFGVVALMGLTGFFLYQLDKMETSDIQKFHKLCQKENINRIVLDMDGDYMECVNGRLIWKTSLEDGA